VNHVLWGGRQNLDGDFSVLDAGCGTGDATIFMAEQLRGTRARLVALDMSAASLGVTKDRAAVRGLEGITFVQSQIEDIPALGLGQFDFVFSSGVLHHLSSPAEGLAALAGTLKPDAGMAIMVYGTYGRFHVYQMQRLLRILAPPALGQDERLKITTRLLERLRPEHWAVLARASWAKEVDRHGQAGLYDLFLHAQDRAYTVPEIHQWLAGAGLRLHRWHLPALYDPETYATGVATEHLSAEDQQAGAELLHGRMATHAFFAVPQDRRVDVPAADDPRAIPKWLLTNAHDLVDRQLDIGRELHISYCEEVQRRIFLDPFTRGVLRRIDDVTPLGTIIAEMQARLNVSRTEQLWERWRHLYREIERLNLVGLAAA
jgi:SAM-dependent methyltransferase